MRDALVGGFMPWPAEPDGHFSLAEKRMLSVNSYRLLLLSVDNRGTAQRQLATLTHHPGLIK